MIRQTFVFGTALLLASAIALAGTGDCQRADRGVTIRTTLRNSDQSPVPDVGVEVSAGGSIKYSGSTDGTGTATASIRVDESCTEIWVGFCPASAADTDMPSEATIGQFTKLLVGRTFPWPARVALSPGVDQYQVVVQLKDAVSLRGRVTGDFKRGDVYVGLEYGPAAAKVDEAGRFKFRAVEKKRAGHLTVVNIGGGGGVMEVSFTAQQASADFDVGDIQVPDSKKGIEVTLKATNRPPATLPDSADYIPNMVVLLRNDGQVIREYDVAADGTIASRFVKAGPVVPPGTYFVVPGGTRTWTLRVAAAKYAVAGSAGLKAAAIPSITVAEGSINDFQLDLSAALEACRKIRAIAGTD